jgi:tetratricopeptide (TPR) repeat protein
VGLKDRSDYTAALEYYYKALNIYNSYNYKSGLANIYGSIGIVHKNMSNLNKALEFYFKALTIDKKIDNKRGVSRHFGNIAIVYRNLKQYDSALIYLNNAIEINNAMNDLLGIANNYISMGQIYTSLEEYPLALKYFTKALEINKKFNRKKGITANYANLGFMYSKMGQYSLAEKYLKMAEAINRELSMREYLKETCSGLHKVYEQTGKSNLALKYYKEYIQIRDSILSEEQRKYSLMKEIQFEYDKKATADSIANAKQIEIKNAELAKNKAEIKAKKQQQIALYGGLLIVILFAGFMYNRFKITNAQKTIIEKQKLLAEEQKLLLSEKNKEITDSINYAKRIQSAIIPPVSFIRSIFPKSFVLYMPKDIVAGDFYWLEKTNNWVYIAAADCTGHGVPGALMSVVCNNALNRSIREFKLSEPGEILDKTREIVISEFQKSEEDLKDGMDISLASFQVNSTNKTILMKWSGANNPLWIINKNKSNETVLNEILPTKQSIGKTDNAIPFSTHTVTLSPGDTIYLFTDGYRDQFGGLHFDSKKPAGKKLKSGRFKQLLISIYDLPLELQKKELISFMQKWRGEMEQIDDICIVGIRV